MKYTILAASCLFLLSCSDEKSANEQTHIKEEIRPKSEVVTVTSVPNSIDEPVLVTVDGEKIYVDDLDYQLNKLFGNQLISEEVEGKLLESLVASKALSIKAEKTLSESEINDINIASNAYKEELLLKRLFQNELTPEVVLESEIIQYYEKNQILFGADSLFFLKKFTLPYSPSEYSTVKNEIEMIANANGWKDAIDLSILESKLVNLKNWLPTAQENSISIPYSNDKNISIYKLVRIQPIPAKPLIEVSGQIRERLAPIKYKKSIKSLTGQALKEVDVVYY